MTTGNPQPGTPLTERIGNTPLVRLDRLTRDLPAITLVAKAEWNNPGGSVKDRAAAILNDAIARGLLMPGNTRERFWEEGTWAYSI